METMIIKLFIHLKNRRLRGRKKRILIFTANLNLKKMRAGIRRRERKLNSRNTMAIPNKDV